MGLSRQTISRRKGSKNFGPPTVLFHVSCVESQYILQQKRVTDGTYVPCVLCAVAFSPYISSTSDMYVYSSQTLVGFLLLLVVRNSWILFYAKSSTWTTPSKSKNLNITHELTYASNDHTYSSNCTHNTSIEVTYVLNY